ncbi:MAG: putative toxin-antitoxin system toxin component, PIN family [Deltaproteobacteria bacterium]|nr:putative toxin-antitoxin system toxin component, PIN family [Deltaproteobacteria bacterium]
MNIVVDTNILVSAVLWKGPPFQALKIILEMHSLVQSQSTIEEFEKVIRREKFRKILEKSGGTPETLIETLILESKFYAISRRSAAKAKRIKIEDKEDAIFLELALEAKAPIVVSGDKHLLDLKEVSQIKFVSAKEFLALQGEFLKLTPV